MTPEELKDLTHSMWDLRGKYYEAVHQIVHQVYEELGPFVVGTYRDGGKRYFLLSFDGRVLFTFKEDGYFDPHPDYLELDIWTPLTGIDYKEFKAAFNKCNEIKVNAFIEGEKYRDTLLRDLNVAEHLIHDAMWGVIKKENNK